MRKFLLSILLIVLLVALIYKSPFSALYNYNKARALYNNGQYEQSLPYFERSLFADKKGLLARFYYVLALSKSKPVYSVQKKLYEMAQSDIIDEASKYAKSQVSALRYKLLDGIDNNYIYNAAMGNDILRWDIKSFPLKVYVEKSSGIPEYYYTEVDKALNEWSSHTNFVKFVKVNDAISSDINIIFKDIPDDLCKDGVCKYTAAYTEPDINKEKLLRKMVLTFYKTNPYKKYFSNSEIFNTALHELGHTLGIMGHSDNPADIMFAQKDNEYSFNAFGNQALSMRDLRTLALLYRMEPSISNVKSLHSESFYYAPLIIGNDDVRLRKKLVENLNYVKQYPQFAAGYINLAAVYADAGDFENSLKTLTQAEQYVQNNDEKFLIYYNRAVVYFNKQEYDKALDSANIAKSVKDNQNIKDLISDIEKAKGIS